ncbi:hypothetical protein AMATHDRAFT_2501 [Amanita thiersii Skay4041]|uniref:Conserved oligomeric Golgi complex subunit 5 n=1 Tax=Amanita thiersii Skay4041 TaxID=703135 RepID=A0A2A9NWD4_9AGAR|nr:hypothetical protein AMATHDRAFT_2501 [Amanita thiersii Skay4041]
MSFSFPPEFSTFTALDFNPSDYANAILSGEPYPTPADTKPDHVLSKFNLDPPAREDLSEAISKLTYNIDDVTKQIKYLVAQHHEDLLSQAASSNELSGSLTSIRANIDELDNSLEKLQSRVHKPYHSLQSHVARLQYLQQASDILRRTSRFVTLARRLQIQITELEDERPITEYHKPQEQNASKHAVLDVNQELRDDRERVLAKAARSLAELATCLDEPLVQPTVEVVLSEHSGQHGAKLDQTTLRSVRAVTNHIPFIEESRTKVIGEMENLLYSGLTSRDSAALASSLQIAYNLRILPELVQDLVSDLTKGLDDIVHNAFDVSKLSKDALTKDTGYISQTSSTYKSRIRTEPTNVTAAQWASTLWGKLEIMLEGLTECCTKVYLLEKVLTIKRDVVTQTFFLEEAMKSLDNQPSRIFWTAMARTLEKHIRDTVKSSTFLQQTLGSGYPKLIRLFHAFFTKIAPHSDTMYTQTTQSPETVLIINALSNLESLYLSRSTLKMNEAISQAFSGGFRSPPSATEGLNLARVIANELDAGKFDPLLARSLAKNVLPIVNSVLMRIDALMIRDRSAFTLTGTAASSQLISNAQLTTCLYQCWSMLERLKTEQSDAVLKIIQPSLQEMRKSCDNLLEPIQTSIRREISAIISKLHRINLGKTADIGTSLTSASFYIRDLAEKLTFIKTEVLSKVVSIAQFTVKTFLLHASIAKPLSESGKLQLANDMTELEFALNAFLADSSQGRHNGGVESIGDEYTALRAMRYSRTSYSRIITEKEIRPLLFLDNEQLKSEALTNGLRPVLVLHHILVRSTVPLPHALHGWQEAEYVRWLDEHSEEEALALIEGGLDHWEKVSEGEDREGKMYADLARTVLRESV